ncbi:hypothetical protein [Arthrobacter sp.]|uniref:hypothetical protein n=1 Tax=Arthrobacter sp. TaxID=1667 RepID=UPI002811E0EA|nr:hypothetical protein [Arthrobacter sp.]
MPVGGVDSPTLRELAGVRGNESRFVLAELVAQTSAELGIGFSPDPTGSIALRLMARRTIAGRLDPGELTSWVSRYIGPATEEFAEPFVHLGWLYDEELLNFTREDIDRAVISEAEAFLAGEPSKWLELPINASNLTVLSHRRSLAARIRGWLKLATPRRSR